MVKKVAYAVYYGRVPGVYRSWTETEAQLTGFSGSSCQGFSFSAGGVEAAKKAFEAHIKQITTVQNKSGNAVPNTSSTSGTNGLQYLKSLDRRDRGDGCAALGADEQMESYAQTCRKTARKLSTQSDSDRPAKTLRQRGQTVISISSSPDESSISTQDNNISSGSVDVAELATGSRSAAKRTGHVELEQSFPIVIDDDGFEKGGTSDYGSVADEDLVSAESQATQLGLPPPPVVEPPLCKEQADLVDIISRGRNVFYTGSAGCGKSTVLKAFVKALKAKSKNVHIIAPTGRAALDINGSTFWTYAGWTPDSMKKSLAQLESAARGKRTWKRLKNTHVLVIDEISMMENHHFERLNKIMRYALDRDKAFGGVQLIVTGDFCQLPPVKAFQFCIICGKTLEASPAEDKYTCHNIECPGDTYLDIDKWAFRSDAWQEADFVHVNLTTIHRQSDTTFKAILEKSRIGAPWSEDDKYLLLNHPSETTDAVKLFPTRNEVKAINDREFTRLRTRRLDFRCYDEFDWNPEHAELQWKDRRSQLDDSLLALKEHRYDVDLSLKEGMLVVLLVNLDLAEGLVNGSQGVITRFVKHADVPVTKHSPTEEQARDLETSNLDLIKDQCIAKFIAKATEKEWPVVRFFNGKERPIIAECTVNQLGDTLPYSLLCRAQIPLFAAWVMTVHKAQGMTLSRVEVDLSKSFEHGQAYVALSRARELSGLKVIRLPRHDQGANEQVREFLRDRFGIT